METLWSKFCTPNTLQESIEYPIHERIIGVTINLFHSFIVLFLWCLYKLIVLCLTFVSTVVTNRDHIE